MGSVVAERVMERRELRPWELPLREVSCSWYEELFLARANQPDRVYCKVSHRTRNRNLRRAVSRGDVLNIEVGEAERERVRTIVQRRQAS